MAQSLIDSAKINAQVKQIQQFDIAVSNFQLNYKGLPGDIATFSNPGDGDGKIESYFSLNPNFIYPHYSGEVRNFWRHLGVTGFGKNKGWDFNNPSDCGDDETQCDFETAPQLDMPPAELFPNTGIGVAYDRDLYGFNKNGYVISKWSIGNSEDAEYIRGKPCAAATALDVKLDDGNESTGGVFTNCFLRGFENEYIREIWIDLLASSGQGRN